MANPAWVSSVNVKFNGSLDNAVVLKDTGTIKSLILWDNLSTADKATLIDAVNKYGGTTPLAAPTSGYQLADFGGSVLGASATGLSNVSTATAGVATIDIGGAGATPTNASGLSAAGNTYAYQDANFAIGTTTTTPTNFTALTAGHQAAHFTVAPVGGAASGLAADTPATHGHQAAHFTVAPTGGAASGLAADTPATAGHQAVNFTLAPVGGAASGLAADTPATQGYATITFDGAVVTPATVPAITGAKMFTVNINGGGGIEYTTAAILNTDDMTAIAAKMTTALGGLATVAAASNTFVVTSVITGAASTIVVTIPTITTPLSDIFGAINTALTTTNTNTPTGGADIVVHTYTASITVDGTHVQAISVAGTVGTGDTFTNVLAKITTDLGGFATVAIVGNDIVVTSASTGAASTVATTDTNLFSTLSNYNAVSGAVAGADIVVHTYTASITVDGTHVQAISVAGTVGTGDTFTNVLAKITTDLAGFATVAIVGNDIVITSASTGAASTVATTDTTLFAALASFASISAAVAGANTIVHTYTASVTIDGTHVQALSVAGTVGTGDTFTNVLATITTNLGAFGTVAIVGNDIVITSASTGTTSTVAITDTTLFAALASFASITAAVPGTGAVVPLTASFVIDGSAHAFSVLPGTMSTFAAVVSAIQTAIGGAGTAAMISTRENTLTSNVITAGSGYTDGTYDGGNQSGVPLSGGTGVGALANITVAGGGVTVVTFTSSGQGYTNGDVLTALTSDLGGVGSGFSFTVTATAARGPDIKVTSALAGSGSSVSIVDGTLFAALPGFVEILPSHAGVSKAIAYRALIQIDNLNVAGAIGTLGTLVAGTGYTAGTYAAQALTGSATGSGATANITVTGITAGNSTVAFSATPAVTPTTLLGIAAGNYTFKLAVDGGTATVYTVRATGVDTMVTMATAMTTAIGSLGTITAVGTGFVFTSKTIGSTSSAVVTIPAGSGTDLVGAINTALTATNSNTPAAGVNGVTSVIIASAGKLYAVGDTLTATFGGGSAFSIRVATAYNQPKWFEVSELAISGDTYQHVVDGINTVLGAFGTAAFNGGGNITITSATTGSASAVAVEDIGELFSSLTGYAGALLGTGGISTVAGTTPITYTATITIDGVAYPVSATGDTMQSFTTLTSVVDTAVSAGGSAAIITTDKITSIGTITGGSLYHPATGSLTYADVPLTVGGGTGTLATADITVTTGAVTAVVIKNPGQLYAVGDVLSASNTDLGGFGSGFHVAVASINSNITIASDTTGGTSTVSIVDGNLFKNVTGFVGFDAAVPGVGGNIATFGVITAGTGYTNGSYTNVSLDGGSGTGATANVTVAGNAVTVVTLVNGGTNYVALDALTINDSVFGKGIASTGTLVGGTGYVTGTYTSIPLNGGTGHGAIATIAVAGGAVTSVTITTAGIGYKVGDVLTASTGLIGAEGRGFSVNVATIQGTGFSIPVATIVTDLETEFFNARAANGSKLTSLFNILYVGAKPAVPPFCPHTTAFRYYGGAGPVWRYLNNDAAI